MVLLFISLLAGMLTVLAPCTISLLPVIVGGTLTGGTSYRRAITVTVSLGISVIVFTYVLKISTLFLNIPQSVWQDISGALIVFLGFTMLIPQLWDRIPFINRLSRDSNKLIGSGYQQQNLIGDILIGAALGPVFSTCSPTYFLILAEVLPHDLIQGTGYLLAYVIGLCASLFVVAVAGQALLEKVGVASDPRGIFKRVIGVLFLVLGVAITTGYDKHLELAAANHFFDVTTIEQFFLANNAPIGGVSTTTQSSATSSATTGSPPIDANARVRVGAKAMQYNRAPEITSPSGYINTNNQPITISQFKGKKVVLIDFWTYSCINCQRTLPYLRAWYDKYHDQGLEIIGIHTPEFGFEKVLSNVQQGVNDDGIKYPVVLDNSYGTWNAFANQYWPRKYLIDIDGFIIYDHAGEGNYDETEAAIQKALAERAKILGAVMPSTGTVAPKDVVTVDAQAVASPETYFGSSRNEYLANGDRGQVGTQALSLPETISNNALYLGGAWAFYPEYAESKGTATIEYQYQARDVYFVASSANGAKLRIEIDGKPIGAAAGADVDRHGDVLVKQNRLYKLVHGAGYGLHTLKITIESGTLDAYTFTFG